MTCPRDCGCGGDVSRQEAQEAEAESQAGMAAIMREEYMRLGPLRFAEATNLVMFVLLVLLWFFRKPGFMPGYADLFEKG